MPSIKLLPEETLLNPPPNLRSDSIRLMAIITVGYDTLSLELTMAAAKESTITNNMTVTGDSAMGMSQQQSAQVHLTLMR